jgi:hypothetical protein
MKYIRRDVNKYEFMTHRSLAGSGAGPFAMGFRWGPSPIKSNKVKVVARKRGENPGAAVCLEDARFPLNVTPGYW